MMFGIYLICMLGYVQFVSSRSLEEGLITPLKDGLFVTGGHELRAQVEEWTILVTLDPPSYPGLLEEDLRQVASLINSPNITAIMNNETKYVWDQRLAHLRRISKWPPGLVRSSPPIHLRAKRGLFDAGGIVLNELFGLATTKEMEECRRIVRDARKNDETIVHAVNNLVTVVNKTREDLIVDRKQLKKTQDYLLEVHNNVNMLQKRVLYYQKKIVYVEINVHLENIFTALENVVQSYVFAREYYTRQRASLELGRLTENLLPKEDLARILFKAKGQRLQPVDTLEWYYQYVIVEPIWGDNETLIYRAKIPLIDGKHYLRYFINTWPVPYNSTHYSLQIDFSGEVGLDT